MISGVLLENGDGGIRTHVPVTRQPHFECGSLQPLRYVSRAFSSSGHMCPPKPELLHYTRLIIFCVVLSRKKMKEFLIFLCMESPKPGKIRKEHKILQHFVKIFYFILSK